MASSKNSKAEKKTKKVGESTESANKPSKSRKDEDLEEQKEKKKNANEKEKDPKKTNKKDNDNNKVKEKKNKNKLSNGHVKENKMLIVPSSSAEEEGESTYEEDNTEITNGRTTETKPNKGKRRKSDDDKVAEDPKTQRFPMHRIKTIIRAEEIDSRVSQEAVFVINKATEKFLEQLTQNAYTCCMQDRKKSLSYKHLSSVVGKQRRYDFLSDFVPEKIKAEDALTERNSGSTGELKNCKT